MAGDFNDEDMIGEVLGARYNLIGRLGQGSVGQVYLAERLDQARRQEAIKVLKPVVAVDPHFVSRFRREARAINRLQHQNIIGVYDFGRLPDGRLFLAMEYADGQRLDQVIKASGALPVGRMMHVSVQLAAAIAHAHGQGVVHRDLKPSNLILVQGKRKRDEVKVLDFGMAKIIAPEVTDNVVVTLPNQTFGTPAYMAPEQIEAPGSDPRSDIYSMGCIFYEMLAGRPPFVGKNIELLMAHKTRMPKLPSERARGQRVPPELDAIIMKCLVKDVSDRYQTGTELLEALQRCPGYRSDSGRRTRRGFASVLPQDFNEDTDVSQSRSAERGFDYWLGTADTQVLSYEELEGSLQEAALELAEALVDAGAATPSLTLHVANLHALVDDASSNMHQLTELESRRSSLEQSARQREGMLRFAISELKFDRAQSPENMREELELQLAALERRLSSLLSETQQQLEAMTEENVTVVAAAARLHDHAAAAHAELARFIDQLIADYQDDLSVAPLIDRYQSIRQTLDDLHEQAGGPR